MPPNPTYIAPHLREHIFRTYEPYLHAAVTAWPDPTWFEVPATIATATFVANLRNAVVSLIRYNWTTVVNLEKLKSIESPRLFVINFDETEKKVWFRSPKAPVAQAFKSSIGSGDPRPATTSISASMQSLVPWRDHTQEEISALCLLIDRQRVIGPFVVAGEVGEALVESLQTQYNVALVYDETMKQTVIT